ncbi:MAG TPA: sugar transferase [Thermoanaerobaculia bacterium]|nr:sugar transferase [Thermoanaerobaculia bacterium]
MSGGGDPTGRGLPRAVEVAAALAGLAVAAPFLLIAGAAIFLTTGKSPIFRQQRVGRSGRLFTLVKLRTMRTSAGAAVTARGDARVTRVGRLLRRTKIDELPELWNVLAGDMAFVGPRPEVPRYFDAADPRWRAILGARPGLTDPVTLRLRDEEELLAGVAGDREAFYRAHLQPWKLRRYAAYLEQRSWRSDLAVLRDTARAVLRPSSARPPTLDDILAEGLQTHADAR